MASHAQKYFIRQNNLHKRKRRSSLFDIVASTVRAPGQLGGKTRGTDAHCRSCWPPRRSHTRTTILSTAPCLHPRHLSRFDPVVVHTPQTPPPPPLPLHSLQVAGSWPVVGVRTGGSAVPPPHLALPGAPTLFGGMPSGTPAMLPLHMPAQMGDIVLGSLGEALPLANGGAVPGGAGSSPSAVLMPMLWQQYMLSGGALGGAAFHRPGPQALVDNPLLFKPKPTKPTAATWGMIKSASMPELGAGGAGDEEFPLPSPVARHLDGLNALHALDSNGHHPMASIQEAGDL